jgi:hypothetical protein
MIRDDKSDQSGTASVETYAQTQADYLSHQTMENEYIKLEVFDEFQAANHREFPGLCDDSFLPRRTILN